MVKNPRQKPKERVSLDSGEALRILASLIAQFHIKKITGGKKPEIQAIGTGELNNDQSLS
jgi:hypothetical protein